MIYYNFSDSSSERDLEPVPPMNDSNHPNDPTLSNELHEIEIFEFYYTPILIFLGTIGNALSVYVFFKTKLKKLSSSYYLSALAISDSAFLLSLLVVWLSFVRVDIFNKDIICQTIVYLTTFTSFLSIWLVAAFTVERFVAVRYPLLRQSVCTTSRAKLMIGIMVVASMMIYSPYLVFAKPVLVPETGRVICMIDNKWQFAAGVYNYVDTVLTFVLPVTTIVVLNGCISRTIWQLARVRRTMTTHGVTVQSGGVAGNGRARGRRPGTFVRNNRLTSSQSTQNKVTKMLLFVSTICLCFNLPSYVLRILTYVLENKVLEENNHFKVLMQFSLILSYTNYGINFALYCISGQNFRKALRSVLCTRCHRDDTTESRTNSSGFSATSRKRRAPFSTNNTQEMTLLNVL
ncbi:somatostatin receptor type 4-like isoform X2 [Agrilus planipennis]|uniref:Somatostatin receptor type 4-like isoform X2 n=1 Tax=Agrilus planipennis TaxID=224129 RepID=A0A1W4XGY9_AGRPL|nr:somatostatin receptor type 4-like isoform X2 [Agrilus planipennis]